MLEDEAPNWILGRPLRKDITLRSKWYWRCCFQVTSDNCFSSSHPHLWSLLRAKWNVPSVGMPRDTASAAINAPGRDHRNSGCGQQRACFSPLGSNSCFLILWGLSLCHLYPSQCPLAEVTVGRQIKIKIQPGLQRIGARRDSGRGIF